MRPFTLLTFSILSVLAGCVSLAPAYVRPDAPVPRQFSVARHGLVAAPADYRDSGWQHFFADPQLRALIATALRNNRDLRAAVSKLQQARAQVAASAALREPQLGTAASETTSARLATNTTPRHDYQAGLNLSFDFDVFGRLASLTEADRQRYYASAAARREVHILLVAGVARTYFNRELAAAQLRVARETLQNSRQAYADVQQRLRHGRADVLALEQARGMVEVASTDIARREGEFARAGDALQLLLGSYPDLPADGARADADLSPVALPEPLPSDILLQRPDIQQAEHALQAANASIGAARAAFFPAITLGGGLSARSPDLATLFDAASGMWSFVPRIELPIFTGGRLQANLDIAQLRRDEAVANYEKKIQTAFREVADALALRPAIAGQATAQRRYLAALEITRSRAWALYRQGAASYLDVLSAERALFATRQNLLALNYARQANEVDLYAALGGGWAD